MDIKMKVAFLCCVLLLAGSASCSPVEAESNTLLDINIPDWILDLVSGLELPEAIQNIIDRLPDIVAGIPNIDQISEIIALIVDKFPEVLPIILDKLPEIIAQLPDLEKPEWWPDELPDLPELPEFNRATPGTPTTVSEFPGIVQIEVGTGPVWVQGCAGSVLTSFHIVSAARCFSGKTYNSRFRRVRAGSSTRYETGFIATVERAINHPSFASDSFDADITIIRLVTNLVLGSTIQQTPIVPQGFNMPGGLAVTLAGWGSTAQGKLISDRDLYKIDLVTVDKDSCADRWSLLSRFTVTDNMICIADAQYGGRNGDVRDIGAPIFYQNILTGIVSFGATVGNQHFPVVTTAVGSYTNWIIANAV